MSQTELEFVDWVAKINERITFLLLNIKEKRDISEEDYLILEFLHKNWYNGVHPLYKTQAEGMTENAKQTALFTDSVAEGTCGTLVDTELSN